MGRLRLMAFVILLLVAAPALPGAAQAIVTGACCDAGMCTETTAAACVGAYQGDGTVCAVGVCPAAVPSIGSSGLVVLAIGLLGAATWLLVHRARPASEA